MILSTQYSEAVQKNWHKKHYCCIECDTLLDGKPSITHEGKHLCDHCYTKYAAKCHRCKKPISIGQNKKSIKGKHYHEECFVCKRCQESLINERYCVIGDDIICSDCIKPVGQCHGCKEGISPYC